MISLRFTIDLTSDFDETDCPWDVEADCPWDVKTDSDCPWDVETDCPETDCPEADCPWDVETDGPWDVVAVVSFWCALSFSAFLNPVPPCSHLFTWLFNFVLFSHFSPHCPHESSFKLFSHLLSCLW